MSGDVDSGGRPRPEFLPPLHTGHRAAHGASPAEQPEPPAAPRPPGSRARTVWSVLTMLAAGTLLVSAFLPWAEMRYVLSLFGSELRQEGGDVAGIEADGAVVVVPVLALCALLLTAWGLVARDPRIALLSAVPGALAALGCGLFVLRLGHAREQIMRENELFGRFDLTLTYGWYLALASALLVTGLALLQPLTARLNRRSRAGADASDRAASPSGP
ncbi:hypothetical protein [Actinomadura flavalba]|uniref:hypothetical protein n=1 Tax=Actinomadura flavalba TaxID=1120938 RepID=UPI0012DEA794|nr:hypothetical protein [Actinomadura flavalba]